MGKKNYAYINKEMLVWARSTTPFETTLDVQERVKIDASKINAWESGEDLPSINEAKKLAALYKIPFATFFLEELIMARFIEKRVMICGLRLVVLLGTEIRCLSIQKTRMILNMRHYLYLTVQLLLKILQMQCVVILV